MTWRANEAAIQGLFLARIDAQIQARRGPQAIYEDPVFIGQILPPIIPGWMIYLFHCSETASPACYLKVGVAENIGKRLSSLKTDCPLEISHVVYFPSGDKQTTIDQEKRLHRLLKKHHHRREWFRFTDERVRAEAIEEIATWLRERLREDFHMYHYNPKISRFDPKVKKLSVYYEAAMQAMWERFAL